MQDDLFQRLVKVINTPFMYIHTYMKNVGGPGWFNFGPRVPNWVHFGVSSIGKMSVCICGLFYCHSTYFMVVWYILW
jgi:hypothetical protein